MLPGSGVFDALRRRWLARRDELHSLHALVDGALLYDELVAELDAALRAEGSAVLSLREAARYSGYTADYLGRLIRAGSLPNAGRRHAPRVRIADLPRKATSLSPAAALSMLGGPRRRVARAVVNSSPKEDLDG